MSSPTRKVSPALLCFVVLWGRFATDIPRAKLLKIKYIQMQKSNFSETVNS